MIGTFGTIGLMVYTSLKNQRKSKEFAAEIKQMQRGWMAAEQERTLKRDYERFIRSCQLQLQMEKEEHEEKLVGIDKEFIDSFKKMAHDAALKSHYPLKISPYVIKNSVIPLYQTQMGNSRIEVFGLLTNSNNDSFNNAVLPRIDEMLCESISKFWNQNSMHTICYYPGVWNEKSLFCSEDIENLKTMIVTPTIAITPYFEKHDNIYRLSLKFNMWGMGNKNVISTSEETGIEYQALPNKYSKEEIVKVAEQLFPKTICNLGKIIDVFYWANYYQSPLLPKIVSEGYLQLDQTSLLSLGEEYAEMYESLALGNIHLDKHEVSADNQALLKDVTLINQYNFPDRGVGFLKSVIALTQQGTVSEELMLDTIASIYEARTAHKVDSISSVNIALLDKIDCNIVTELISLAKRSGNIRAAEVLADIIERKILYWN